MLLKPDSRLGHYIIREHKGKGGMGAVYRARDTRHGGREVAIKTILPKWGSQPDAIPRFRLEALAIAQLDHPNIVKLIEFVEGDSQKGEPSYIVMEFLKGDDLDRMIKKTGPLGIERAVDIMLEVCAAVGTCHSAGFLHRDLKPSNIFVAAYDGIEVVKVLDFGTAKMWEDVAATAPQSSDLTNAGRLIGTTSYQAPELIRGEKATPKSDQYALGVALFETLTGHKPFRRKRPEDRDIDVQYAISKGDHPSAGSLRPDIPEGLDAAIERAMHRESARRFGTIREFGAALLPFASEAGRLRYTAHFTRPLAPLAIRAQLSIAISAGEFAADGEDANAPANTVKDAASSTLAVPRDGLVTRPFASAELKVLAGGQSTATTVREPQSDHSREGISIDPSISIAFEDPAEQKQERPDSADIAPRSIARRPARMVAVAGGVVALALGVVYGLHRSGPKPFVPAAPPPAIVSPSVHERPRSPAAPVPTVPDQPQTAAPPAAAPAPPVSSPAGLRPPARPHHPAHRKKKAPDLDEKGVPIPSL